MLSQHLIRTAKAQKSVTHESDQRCLNLVNSALHVTLSALNMRRQPKVGHCAVLCL